MRRSSAARWPRWLIVLSVFLSAPLLAQSVVTRGDRLSMDYSIGRDQLVVNLLGNLWSLPGGGGVATLMADAEGASSNPSWSPDSRQIVFEAGGFGGIQILNTDDGSRRRVSDENVDARFPNWHPSGDRVLYSARQAGGHYDLWEVDLATNLRWRLTRSPGEDREASWSADGRDLVWVRQLDHEWQLVIRPFGQPDTVIKTSAQELRAPSWRPDGTLVTYFERADDGFELKMMILSDPALERTLVRETGLYPSRIAWEDRNAFFYSSSDHIKRRDFDDWSGRIVNFRASVGAPRVAPAFAVASRELKITTPAERPLVIRAARLFDGRGKGYRNGVDVLISEGLVAEVTARKDWADIPIIDLPSTTLVPGLVDSWASLPADLSATDGAALLAWGITTMVTRIPDGFDPGVWESESTPGPRLLPATTLDGPPPDVVEGMSQLPYLVVDTARTEPRAATQEQVAAWQTLGVPVLATSWRRAGALSSALFMAGDQPATVGAGGILTRRDSGFRETLSLTTRQLLSGLADTSTPGIEQLYESRQASFSMRQTGRPLRRRLLQDLRRSSAPVALASAANGMHAGLATHAELLALADGKLSGDQILIAAGRNPAGMLGLAGKTGEISVGASADLLLVSGDPLTNINDLRNVVAVVRNGRFFSLVNLLERRTTVE